jgi:hypothetical protein
MSWFNDQPSVVTYSLDSLAKEGMKLHRIRKKRTNKRKSIKC